MSPRLRTCASTTVLALAAAMGPLATPAHADPAQYRVEDRVNTGGATADALPTTQIDGVAYTQVIAGNTVFVGGNFANARPAGAAPGTQLTPRANLLAYDLTTGELRSDMKFDTNGTVKSLALSPDGSRLYVGGSFTSIGGKTRYRLAAIDVATGQVIGNFAPTINATVDAIAVTKDAVYIGGGFGSVKGQPRQRLAALSSSTGALLGWAPTANTPVRTMVATPDQQRIIIGGNFSLVNGSSQRGSAALSASDGSVQRWDFNKVVRNAGSNAGIYSLNGDGRNIIATGYSYLSGQFEGAALIEPTTGALTWMADCHGDSYSAAAGHGQVYVASHHHHCDNINSFPQINSRTFKYAQAFTYQATGTVKPNSQAFYTNYRGNPAPSQVNWFPEFSMGTKTGLNQSTWSVTTHGDYVVYGGEFPRVNGVPQQGLVRFARPGTAPRKQGPVEGGAEMRPTIAVTGTQAKLHWRASSDRDNKRLRYEIRREGVAAPVGTVEGDSLWWDRPTLSYTDTDLEPGRSYTYWIVAVDPDGNRRSGDKVTITAAPPTPSDTWTKAVRTDQPTHFWRMADRTGRTFTDEMGTNHLTSGTAVARYLIGMLPDNRAARVLYSPAGWAATTTAEQAPAAQSSELWFRTSVGNGGVLMSLSQGQGTRPAVMDRVIYLTNNGRVAYGVTQAGTRKAITSTGTYRDNKWHHVVSTISPTGGLKLYVDGQLVAEDKTVTASDRTSGHWQLGGATPTDLPNKPSALYGLSFVDEVSVYPSALTAEQVAAHYAAGKR